MRTLSLLWAAALLASPPLVAQASPDWNRIADLTVTRTLALAPGERVVIHHDATRDAGLVAALRAAITKAGGIVAGELVWPVGATAAMYDSMSPPTLAARVAQPRRLEHGDPGVLRPPLDGRWREALPAARWPIGLSDDGHDLMAGEERVECGAREVRRAVEDDPHARDRLRARRRGGGAPRARALPSGFSS